jgi:hypothetical protein
MGCIPIPLILSSFIHFLSDEKKMGIASPDKDRKFEGNASFFEACL